MKLGEKALGVLLGEADRKSLNRGHRLAALMGGGGDGIAAISNLFTLPRVSFFQKLRFRSKQVTFVVSPVLGRMLPTWRSIRNVRRRRRNTLPRLASRLALRLRRHTESVEPAGPL